MSEVVDEPSFLPPDIAKSSVVGYDCFQAFDITDIIVSLAFQILYQSFSDARRRVRNGNTSFSQRFDLSRCRSFATGYNSPGMTHSAPWGRRNSGDKSGNRFIVMLFYPDGSLFLRRTANLANQDQSFGILIFAE